MEYHEAAKIFPMDEDSIQELAEDIQKHGLIQPIEVFEGKILDGRRRAAACLIAGVEPDYSEVNPVDPVAYVLSLNLHRRHLTQSQKAMIAANAVDVYEKLAKKRMSAGGGDKKSSSAKSGIASGRHPIQDAGKSSDKAGLALGVSGRSVSRAKRVQSDGAPEVSDAVASGKISLVKAEEIVQAYPKSEQPRVLQETLEDSAKKPSEVDAKSNGETKLIGKGVALANEAINCLIRIPKNDPLRKRGFQIVTDWIKANK